MNNPLMFVAQELYSEILKVMPIPCVDLLTVDEVGNILLLLRKNEPGAGQWWFPGGRVLFGEQREDAARRKLLEECGLVSTDFSELETTDLLFRLDQDTLVHSITTLFQVNVSKNSKVRLDNQSLEYRWAMPETWLKHDLHPFIRQGLLYLNRSIQNTRGLHSGRDTEYIKS